MDRNMFDMSEFYREVGCTKAERKLERARMRDMGENGECDDPLTMVFINMQPLDSVYTPCDAFCNGTLFPNLNKPFMGGMR